MKSLVTKIKEWGVPKDAIEVFNPSQLKVVFLLLDHGRLTAEQVENVAENLKYAEQIGQFSE